MFVHNAPYFGRIFWFVLAITSTTTLGSDPSRKIDCHTLCKAVPACRTDPKEHGSYCKTDKDPNVCFGLFFTDRTRRHVCFEPNDRTCPQEFPVLCGPANRPTDSPTHLPTHGPTRPPRPLTHAPTRVPPPPTHRPCPPCPQPPCRPCPEIPCPQPVCLAPPCPFIPCLSGDSCKRACASIPECLMDPKKHGSYCKTWENPPTCFGINFRDASRTSLCFEPNDKTCNNDIPLYCWDPHVPQPRSSTTTIRPSTTLIRSSTTVSGSQSRFTTIRSSTIRSSTTTTTTTTTTTLR